MIDQVAEAKQTAAPLRVTFDCPGAGPLFSPELRRGIGGAEVRAVTFARALARDFATDVRFVVANSASVARSEKIRVIEEGRGTSESRWGRAAQRLCGSLEKRLFEIPERRRFHESLETDVLCCFGVTNRTAGLVRSARRVGTATVVFLTSDRTLTDLQRNGRRNRGVYGELGFMCRYAIRHADAVVVQKRSQLETLNELDAVKATLIRNPIELKTVVPEPEKDIDVLWVVRGDDLSKRADLAMEIAAACPELRFLFIMNRHDDATYSRLMSECPANVKVVEQVPFDQVEHYYARSCVLLNTSESEGFPNSFLQAAKYGLPLVSLNVDPDNIIHDYGLGYQLNGDLEATATQLKRLIHESALRVAIDTRARRYVAEHHALDVCTSQLFGLLHRLSYRSMASNKGVAA